MNREEYLPRVVDSMLTSKLQHAGAVVIKGPKWCGKTQTALRSAGSALFMQDPDTRESNLQLAELKPSLLLRGEKPRLIDEWQEAPQLWDAVRFAVDRQQSFGCYILTGSATPKKKPAHSGVGRMSFLQMRPMTLFESKESTGEVSLEGLFNGEEVSGRADTDIEDIAFLASRGGWPSAVTLPDKESSLETAYDYIKIVSEEDISNVDNVERSADYARLVMRAYARCCGTQANMSSMSKDAGRGKEISRPTFLSYVAALRKLSILEDLDPWEPSLRSKTRIVKTPKRYYVDPSLAIAAMGASPGLLLQDVPTLGLMFENMCVRDLRVYAERMHAHLLFYHDGSGLEADAVVVARDGRWGLVEMKMSTAQAEAACETLNKVAAKIDQSVMGAPSFRLVITSTGYAYRREDGAVVCPLSCLAP